MVCYSCDKITSHDRKTIQHAIYSSLYNYVLDIIAFRPLWFLIADKSLEYNSRLYYIVASDLWWQTTKLMNRTRLIKKAETIQSVNKRLTNVNNIHWSTSHGEYKDRFQASQTSTISVCWPCRSMSYFQTHLLHYSKSLKLKLRSRFILCRSRVGNVSLVFSLWVNVTWLIGHAGHMTGNRRSKWPLAGDKKHLLWLMHFTFLAIL